jgi:hypothetical protein
VLVSSTSGRPGLRAGVLALAIIVVLAGVAAAAILLGVGAKRSTPTGLIRPLEKTTTNGSPSTPASTAHLRTTRTPFEAGQVRFVVLVNSPQAWTNFARHVKPGAGNRWVLVTVLAQNLGRVGFDPRVLHYRLIANDGANYFPDLTYGTGPHVHIKPRPLPIGAQTQAELAFAVPRSAVGVQLAFDPTGKHQRVVVGLGQ